MLSGILDVPSARRYAGTARGFPEREASAFLLSFCECMQFFASQGSKTGDQSACAVDGLDATPIPIKTMLSSIHTAWNTNGPTRPPIEVKPSAWERTPPATHTIQMIPTNSNTTPAINMTIFMTFPPSQFAWLASIAFPLFRPRSCTHSFHEQPECQNCGYPVDHIARNRFRAKPCRFSAENLRHSEHDSDEGHEPDQNRRYPPPHD